MSKVSEIELRMEGGVLTCVGELDTTGAEFDGADDGGWMCLFCPVGFSIRVLKDGEIRVDGQSAQPLVPGLYQVTEDGLMFEGEPVCGPAATDAR